MRRSRYSEEQIIGILKEHQAGLGAKELCRKHGISDATFYDRARNMAAWMCRTRAS
jgi:putative transposase